MDIKIKTVPPHLIKAGRVKVGQKGHVMAWTRESGLLKYLVKLQGRSWPVALPVSCVEVIERN